MTNGPVLTVCLCNISFVNATVSSLFGQVQKLAITVELLLGDIPDRAIFRQPSMRKTLAPYFQLTQGTQLVVDPFLISWLSSNR